MRRSSVSPTPPHTSDPVDPDASSDGCVSADDSFVDVKDIDDVGQQQQKYHQPAKHGGLFSFLK